MTSNTKRPDAFLDLGYPPGYAFREKFLTSPEFTVELLKGFNILKRSELKNKEGYAIDIAGAIEDKQLNAEAVLLRFVKKRRTWLSLKLGNHSKTPSLMKVDDLLESFGETGWYGPVQDTEAQKKWYIYADKIPYYIPNDSSISNEENQKKYDIKHIRWHVIAEVTTNYVALSWEGFSTTMNSNANTRSQYPFWSHIPSLFDELQTLLGGNWKEPDLHILLLHTLWDKFLNDPNHKWSHKRVRAESSGIALNAHSSADNEVDVEGRGLKGLSHTLAESVLEALQYPFPYDVDKLGVVETAILHTLIREWGPKSYEFSLKKINGIAPDNSSEKQDEDYSLSEETIFRVHCYFGLHSNSKNQDSLRHLKCYKECGGSVGALEFILQELGVST